MIRMGVLRGGQDSRSGGADLLIDGGHVEGAEDMDLRVSETSRGEDEEVIVVAEKDADELEVANESLGGGSGGGPIGIAIEALKQVEGHEGEELYEDEAFETGDLFEEQRPETYRGLPLVVGGFDVVLFFEGGEDLVGGMGALG